jgi:hypothetical protein
MVKGGETETQFNFYNVMATQTLLYGSDAWLRRKTTKAEFVPQIFTAAKECTREDRIRN